MYFSSNLFICPLVKVALDAALGSAFEVFGKELYPAYLRIVGKMRVDFGQAVRDALLELLGAHSVQLGEVVVGIYEGGEADLEDVLIALIKCNAPLQSIKDALRMGADINPADFYHSPLITAIKCNAADSVIKLLLDNDAEIEPISIFMPAYVEDVIEYDSYMDSRIEDEEGIIRDDPSYEEKYGPDEDDIESCRQAAIDRLPAMIEDEWQKIMDREEEMYSSSTALMFAIRSFSNTEVLDMLIKAGADINRKNIFYVTPLRHHANHNELSRLELTPLAVACLIDNKLAIRYLQEMDAILGDSRDEVIFCHPDDVAGELRKLYSDYDLDDLLL